LTELFPLCEHCLRAGKLSDGSCRLCHFDGVPRNRAPSLPEGTAIGGRYVLGRQEGQGGFSICYRGWDCLNEKMVAVKELFPSEIAERLDDGRVCVAPEHRTDFDTAVNSLCHEADVLRKLVDEPAIVRVGDVLQDNDTAYLSMEYLRGQSYDKYLNDQYARNRAHLDVGAAVSVALTILGALEAVHARGLLHLDVKPANIRVLDNGRIVLLDFGSARDAFRLGNGPYGDTFTPGFAALEQHSADGLVTSATDIHALAATLYYSLSLTVPTRADERQQGAALVPLSELNPSVVPAFDAVILKAMALDPANRYPGVSTMRKALEPFATIQRPARRTAVPMPWRAVAGLLDVVVALLLLAALTAAQVIPSEDVFVTGVVVWWAMQLLPLAVWATPGMLIMGLRLTDQSGGAVRVGALLFRTMMLIVTCIAFRFRSDSAGLLMHDRMSGSRVAVK
jgi:Protein kinase domain